MPHTTPLIATIVAGLGLAFLFGALAHRLRISPIVGYLLAGVAVGPSTPGFVADADLAGQLAEIGVILLMFGVGLHFSLKDLLAVKAIAVPGALGQMAITTLLGMGLARVLGWTIGAGFIFGLALSVASTVVVLRVLQERRILDSERGRVTVGWLVVEDLAMVLALVLAPAVASLLNEAVEEAPASGIGVGPMATAIGLTLFKVGAFVALMLVVGRRVIPWVLHYVAHTGSRELFRLAVLAIALGVAYGATSLFGVSFALGAFFAGMVLAESQLSQRAAEEALPFRDAFAVLFFVSVGMLLDPTILLARPLEVIATFLIITLGDAAAAFAIVRAFGQSLTSAFTISVSLAQIGEFSFILASLGVVLGLMPKDGRDLILAGAILSILANPLFFLLLDRLRPWFERPVQAAATPSRLAEALVPLEPTPAVPVSSLRHHAVLVGYGRVGQLVGRQLRDDHRPFLVFEHDEQMVERLRAQGVEAYAGNAADPDLLRAANLPAARTLLVAIPDAFEAGQIVAQAREAKPELEIIARAHSDAEVEHLTRLGATHIVMGERELALGMLALMREDGAAPEPPPADQPMPDQPMPGRPTADQPAPLEPAHAIRPSIG